MFLSQTEMLLVRKDLLEIYHHYSTSEIHHEGQERGTRSCKGWQQDRGWVQTTLVGGRHRYGEEE